MWNVDSEQTEFLHANYVMVQIKWNEPVSELIPLICKLYDFDKLKNFDYLEKLSDFWITAHLVSLNYVIFDQYYWVASKEINNEPLSKVPISYLFRVSYESSINRIIVGLDEIQ